MTQETLKLKCPGDGLVLTIKYVPGIENKSLTCPKCGRKRKVCEYINLSGIPFVQAAGRCDDETDDDSYDGRHEPPSEDSEYKQNKYNVTVGQLLINPSGKTFQLKLGRNVIGRKSRQSSADIQIDCTTRRMSRDHLVIDVVKESLKGIVHYASLYKAAVNDTFIGQMKLEYGDKIPLSNGALIKLPDVDVTFIIPDEEATDMTT